MPSLSALREFKASFDDIGGQKADLAARDIPLDEIRFPTYEPEPMALQSSQNADGSDDDFGDTAFAGDEALAGDEAFADNEAFANDEAQTGDEASAAADTPDAAGDVSSTSVDDLDFSAFLGVQPEHIQDPPADDSVFQESTQNGEIAPGIDDEFNFPDELLSDLSSENRFPADLDAPISPSSDGKTAAAADSGDFDLGSFEDLNAAKPSSPEMTSQESDEDFDLGNLDDLDFSQQLVQEAPVRENEESIDLSNFEEPGIQDNFSSPEPALPEVVSPESISPEPAAPDTSLSDAAEDISMDDLDDFGMAEDSIAPETAEAGKTAGLAGSADSFENFDLGGGAGSAGDFSFPGLDNILDDLPLEKKPTGAAAVAGRLFNRNRGRAAAMPDNPEEIQLTEDELDYLKETLAGYPLNLRIACEEIIAEQLISPEQMLRLIQYLVQKKSVRETASLASTILGRTISIPKGFEKSSGEELEAEQASFAYIFVHKFLPVLRIVAIIAVLAASLFYLIYEFVYTPVRADSIYKIGIERIYAGEYQRANERFREAFGIHRKKNWFYTYAEAFRDERQYIFAEQKYDELLRAYPRDKKGVLDYAALETYYMFNYAKADSLLRRQLLDYAPNDFEGLLAAGDNSLAWGETEPSRYEDARYSYARLLDKYGWIPPIVERMMKYFIRTDNLREVLPLRKWFEEDPKKRKLSAATLAELGGYFLDKQQEEVRGVPNEYVDQIEGVRDILLRAVAADPSLPEAHYHLARYYHGLGSVHEERVTLEQAVMAFDHAREESVKRLHYRIDTHQRLADVLINAKEFIPAENQLVAGINLYESAITRRLFNRSPKYGKLYAGLGDLEYFTKTGDMEAALRYYNRSRDNGWAPPEMLYRMGSAYYSLEDWKNALEHLFAASANLPLNRRILYSLGNAALKRGDYFAANGYYNRLLEILESQRARLPVLLPNDRPEYLELAERLMMARNNAGVACEMLAAQTGNRSYLTRAMSFYAEASRAWDARTRDPRSMIRSSSTPLPYLNSRNALYPQSNYEPQIFIRIDRDASENSIWEELAPTNSW